MNRFRTESDVPRKTDTGANSNRVQEPTKNASSICSAIRRRERDHFQATKKYNNDPIAQNIGQSTKFLTQRQWVGGRNYEKFQAKWEEYITCIPCNKAGKKYTGNFLQFFYRIEMSANGRNTKWGSSKGFYRFSKIGTSRIFIIANDQQHKIAYPFLNRLYFKTELHMSWERTRQLKTQFGPFAKINMINCYTGHRKNKLPPDYSEERWKRLKSLNIEPRKRMQQGSTR